MEKFIIDTSLLFHDGATIPQNTSLASSAVEVGNGASLGATEIVVVAKTAVALADTKIATLTISDSATSGGNYVDIVSASVTASGATTFAVGDVIVRAVVPSNSKKYLKATITTDDAVATGTFDCFGSYLAR